MSTLRYYQHPTAFKLECGVALSGLRIAWQAWGTLNEKADNVIWICHAYTANSDVEDWWPGTLGPGLLFDTNKYFIVCANVIGSCYGSTGPLDVNPATAKPYYRDFPLVTARDVAATHELLRQHLGIRSVFLAIGGSIGGFQAIEWSILHPKVIRNLVFIAANAKASPWQIAFNEAQRMAIMADASFFEDREDGGMNGLRAARAMALISYRTREAYNATQADEVEKLSNFKASSYQQYQGEKLIKRYNAYSYLLMSKLFDSHDVGRGRGGVEQALQSIQAHSLVIALDTDKLFPPEEQEAVAQSIPHARLEYIHTRFGHDGFLTETDQLTEVVTRFIQHHAKQ